MGKKSRSKKFNRKLRAESETVFNKYDKDQKTEIRRILIVIVSLLFIFFIIKDFDFMQTNISVEYIFIPISGLFFLWSIYNVFRQFNVKSWKKTYCKIIDTKIESNIDGRGNRTYTPLVFFRYSFDNNTYDSHNISFGQRALFTYNGASKILDNFEPQSKDFCYVNPENPKNAVLRIKFKPFIPITLFILSIGIMILYYKFTL